MRTGVFAAIHASRVIHFLKPEDVRKTIQKMYRWLQPGGKLFLIADTPYIGYWASKAPDYETRKAAGDLWPGYIDDVSKFFDARDTDGAPPLINSLDPDILRRECSAVGLCVEKVGFFEGSFTDQEIKGSKRAGKEHVGIIAVKPTHKLIKPHSSSEPTVAMVSSSDGVPICYQVQGFGTPTLVFVHGGMCNRSYWKAQVEHCVSRYTVVTMDLAGHGDSGMGRKYWTMEAFGQDIATVVNHLDLKQVILIAHSMSCPSILEAASLIPERVIGLVGVGMYDLDRKLMTPDELEFSLTPMRTNFVKAIREAVEQMFLPTSDPTLKHRIMMEMSSASPEMGIEAMEESYKYSLQAKIQQKNFSFPLVLINSSEFAPTNLEAARRYEVEVKLMDEVGHFCMLEDPSTFNRLLGESISTCTGKNLSSSVPQMKTASLPAPDSEDRKIQVTSESIRKNLKELLAVELSIAAEAIDDSMPFTEMGLDSISGVTWIRKINTYYGLSIAATKIYDCPSIHKFVGFLEKEIKKQGGIRTQEFLHRSSPDSLNELLQQVKQKKMDIREAEQLLDQLILLEEHREEGGL